MKSAIIEAAEYFDRKAGQVICRHYSVMWGYCTECQDKVDEFNSLAQRLRAEPSGWQPIETAPKDNKRPLYLARFNEAGELQELDWNGGWDSDSESWEIPEIYYYWGSNNGIDEPTHWAYQDGPPPSAVEPSGWQPIETAPKAETARPLSEWHEDDGDVLWWKPPVAEAPWVGSPLDSGWPGYHTHWTPLPAPPFTEVD